MKIKITVLLASLLLAGCSPREAHLTVINGTSSVLTNIVASGTGFSVSVGQIQPNGRQEITITPCPKRGVGVKLDFDAGGKHFSWSREDNTWHGAKEVILTVNPEFLVEDTIITSF